MLQLNEKLAKEFMKEHPEISVLVKGGGTRIGILDLIKGKCDIAASSRNLKPDESKLLADYYGSLALIFLIAKDGLSIFVNPDNKIDNLSTEQIKKIFTGKIKNWNQVGGENEEILVVTRNPNSGTFIFFKEFVLEGEDYTDLAISTNTAREMVEYISKNKNSIGYGGIGYNEYVKLLKIDEVYPDENNVKNDTYPFTRYLHFFTTKAPSGFVKKFIDWTLSPTGQQIIKDAGFISLWDYTL
jgi:phosphate transport system substrate-binding protein